MEPPLAAVGMEVVWGGGGLGLPWVETVPLAEGTLQAASASSIPVTSKVDERHGFMFLFLFYVKLYPYCPIITLNRD